MNFRVPQTSKLDPWLFIIYIQDIPKHLYTLLAIYMNEIAIMTCNKNTNYMHTQLQSHITHLEIYFKKVSLNQLFSKKCSLPSPLNLNGSTAQFGLVAEYLGVISYMTQAY